MSENIDQYRFTAAKILREAEGATDLLARLRQEGTAHALLRRATELKRLQALRQVVRDVQRPA